MKHLLLILSFFLFAQCSSDANELPPPTLSYTDFLKQTGEEKAKLQGRPLDEARAYLFTLINEKIPAYWNGTPWDFNGTTRTPNKGQIACGYFITNTLTDLGFQIERIKLAQAASSVLIKATAVNIFTTSSFDKLKAHIKTQPDKSVFIVGLDFHTGYITYNNGKAYFIHSNYINRAGVMKEEIDKSDALKNNKFFMIGNVSANDDFIRKWVQ